MKRIILLLFFIPAILFAESFYSPTWGFSMDLPEGYEYVEGNGKDRFSFSGPSEVKFDLIVYNNTYKSIKELADDANRRLGNSGSADFFTYREKEAALIELKFGEYAGWALCVPLSPSSGASGAMLLALSYSPVSGIDMNLFHMSALDSVNPADEDRYYPGPIMDYAYPRGELKQVQLAQTGASAMIRENDAEAAQALIEREFNILVNYMETPFLKEAWIRYYRFICRDSFDRVTEAAVALVNIFGGNTAASSEAKREFAQTALTFVQGFEYERNFEGSDFTNLVTAVIEGRGDCDSRAMLWAIILVHAEIQAAMMISPEHGHAMGLADIAGAGARFEANETKWLVAETTAKVDIGLIEQEMSDPEAWIGIIFD